MSHLPRDLSRFIDRFISAPSKTVVCFKKHSSEHVLLVMSAWMEFFNVQGAEVRVIKEVRGR